MYLCLWKISSSSQQSSTVMLEGVSSRSSAVCCYWQTAALRFVQWLNINKFLLNHIKSTQCSLHFLKYKLPTTPPKNDGIAQFVPQSSFGKLL